MEKQPRPIIYVAATPIGNLGDLTPRVKAALEEADLIAAEDTRNTRNLLNIIGISGKKLVSYHDHGEKERAEAILKEVVEGELACVIVSDAGTPCISDPGFRLVALAKAEGVTVQPLPGPSSLTALVSASGLPSDRLLFTGFLPNRAQALQDEVSSWRALRASIVFFESTRRLGRTLEVIAQTYPGSRVAIGRELTKLYEEIVTLPVLEALLWVRSHATLKGEACVMVELGSGSDAETVDAEHLTESVARDFAAGASLKGLLLKYKDCGLKRAELYELLLKVKSQSE